MDAQKLLESYLASSDTTRESKAEALYQVLKRLVHKAVARYPTGDLDDFEEECLVAVWCKISVLASSEPEGCSAIENIEAFVRQAVHNRYCDAIRRKRPKWYSIKLELMETLSGKTGVHGFALWQCPKTGVRMCGFSDWQGQYRSATAKCRVLLDDRDRFKSQYLGNREPRELPIYELVGCVFDYCGGPVELDTLTGCIAELIQARNEDLLSIDAVPDTESDSGAPIDWLVSSEEAVEDQVIGSTWFHDVLEWFWKEFLELSVKQRKAMMLGMSPEQVMAIISTVGLDNVAEALELTPGSLSDLISQLPLPDSEIARELNIPIKAVPSVRFKAWARVRRRTQKSGLVPREEFET